MKMIRLTEEANSHLDELAQDTGQSKQELMSAAIKMLAADYFFKKADQAYAALKKDSKAWKEELAERAEWETAQLDGLKNDD